MKTTITSLLLAAFLLVGANVNSQTVNITGVTLPNNATSCTTSSLTVNITCGCINWTYINTTFSVTGNTINVSVNYTAPFICLGAIAYNTHTANFPSLSGGTYNVIVKSYGGSLLQETWPTQTMVVTSCGPEADFDLEQAPFCLGDTIFATNTSQGSTSYAWLFNGNPVSTNVDEEFVPTVTGPAEITLIASDGSTFDTTSTTVNVLAAAPAMSLGNDTSICSYDEISITGGSGYSVINWSTGDTAAVISVGTGTYILSVSNSESCVAVDEIVISQVSVPNLSIDEPAELNCDMASLDASSGFSTYSWSNGATTAITEVTSSGTYFVTAATPEGCVEEDSVEVNIVASPIVNLGSDTTYCKSKEWQHKLSAPLTGDRLWFDGATSPVKTVYNTPGIYWLQITDSNGCVGSDTIELKEKKCTTAGLAEQTTLLVQLYPNPAEDVVFVESSSQLTSARIMTIDGAVVKQVQLSSNRSQLDVSALSPGVYSLKLIDETGATTHKTFIAH